jgi:hypothetical protein
MASHLETAKTFFDRLDKKHMDLVAKFYDPSAVFQDPVHQLQGAEAITRYYQGLYENVEAIRFEYRNALENGETLSLEWRMYLKAPALNGGKEITVDGNSLITFGGPEGKAIRHRDYFDMGEFIYERVPVLGSIIGLIKGRMAR